jgi:hypothetical protein
MLLATADTSLIAKRVVAGGGAGYCRRAIAGKSTGSQFGAAERQARWCRYAGKFM